MSHRWEGGQKSAKKVSQAAFGVTLEEGMGKKSYNIIYIKYCLKILQ